MKKKQKENSLSDVVFKILVGLTVLVFLLILINQPGGSYSVKENKLRTNEPQKFRDSRPTESVPSELKWFDVFKGVGNE